MSKIRPVPQAFREDRDATGFFEDLRERTADAETGRLGTVLQAAAVADPTGGAVIDVECRAQLVALLTALKASGALET